jgi:hypothetical protein
MAKLASSGLSAEQALKLGIYSVDNAAKLHDSFDGKSALVLPYYDINAKPQRAHPAWPDFYRIRYLNGSAVNFGEDSKRRYTQPPDTGACAYFPKLANWKAIAANSNEPILITEGELKAAKATAEGFPTIGLGGVYNFRSAKEGYFFLPELETFAWARRRVTIVYDSDYQKNPSICMAINVLAEELSERGALVSVAMLEDVYDDDKKTGLDDYLVERGAPAFMKLLETAEPLTVIRRLWAMNDEVVYVAHPGVVVDMRTSRILPVQTFTSHSSWSTESVPERKVRANGTMSLEKTNAAATWLKWPLRRCAEKLSYIPGKDQFIEINADVVFNNWRGWGVTPSKGDVKPFLKLFDFVFEGLTKQEKDWVLNWMAYPIKHPGTKLFQAVIVHGRTTGTGKTFIGYTLKRIYGDNFIKIRSEDLRETWWAENRQFVLGDEISGSDKRADADALKTMITQEEVNVNVKYIPQYRIPDCVNYYLTSNHADALWLEDEDRRFFVHEVPHTVPMPRDFYRQYEQWLDNGGAENIMYWLQHRDVSAFDPKGPAPRTDARHRMIIMGKGDLDGFITDLKINADSILRVGQMKHRRDLFTSREIMEFYLRDNESAATKVTANGVARALAKAGFAMAYKGQPIPTQDGKAARYFIIRNRRDWETGKKAPDLAKNIALQPVKDR